MNALLGLLLLALLISIGILIALAEIAFAAAREIRIRALAEQGDVRALRFIKLRASAGSVITALQISTNAVSIRPVSSAPSSSRPTSPRCWRASCRSKPPSPLAVCCPSSW